MFQQNDSKLFDSVNHTQAGQPHLLQYLWNKYREYLEEKVEERTKAGRKSLSVDEAIPKVTAIAFLKFATDHLTENRVVENFFVDANHGIRLANNQLVVICPGIDLGGTMQESGAIAVTEGKSQSDNHGIQISSTQRI